MKRLLALVLAVFLVTTLVACGPKTPEVTGNKEPDRSTTVPVTTVATTDEATEAPLDLSSWGQEDTVWTNNGEVMDGYTIRVPGFTGNYHMYAKISEQFDHTVVLLSGQDVDTPVANELSKVFATYIDCIKSSLQNVYGVQSSNYQITVDTSEPVTIGDHNMYVHTGTITYDYEDTHRSHQYVAYATLMKDSGNSAYWMVYDFSEDQSNGDLIAEHALNMAKTFQEIE